MLSPEQAAWLSSRGAPKFSVFTHIGTPQPYRLWAGPGYFETEPTDTLDPSARYVGAGIMRDFPEVSQLVNGTAERIEISFVGSAAVPASWADDDNSPIMKAPLNLGVVYLNHNYAPMSEIGWFWEGTIDLVTSRGAGGVRNIALSAISGAYDRQRAAFKYWSNAAHQARHPGDRFFERIEIYSPGAVRKWPG